MASIIYATATDHVNLHPYSVSVPAHFATVIHRSVEEGNLFAPIYEPFDSRQQQSSMITIAKMVEFVISSTTFTITKDYDVLEILHQIDAYIDEVFPMINDKIVSTYVDRVLRLRSRIYVLFRRILNRRPQWQSAYGHENTLFEMLAEVYRPLGVSFKSPQTLFEDLVVCPTVKKHPEQFGGILMNRTPTDTQKTTDGRPYYHV